MKRNYYLLSLFYLDGENHFLLYSRKRFSIDEAMRFSKENIEPKRYNDIISTEISNLGHWERDTFKDCIPIIDLDTIDYFKKETKDSLKWSFMNQ